MQENKDPLKAIQNFAQNQPQRTDKLEQAKQLTEELYGQDGEGRKPIEGEVLAANKRTKILSVCLALAAVLLVGCIFLITFWVNRNDGPRYFDEASISTEQVTDIETFVDENSLDFLYYQEGFALAEYSAHRLEENNQLVYVIQNVFFISEHGFDTLQLGICFSADNFQRFDSFKDLDESLIVENIIVNYKVDVLEQNYIYAKFVVDDVIYYLNVTTFSGVESLQHYVALLLQ